MKQALKKIPLGLPLTVSGLATIATIFAGKKAHIAFGAFWGLLSILHGLQHAGKLEHDAKELIGQTAHRATDKAEQISLARISPATYRGASASTTSRSPAMTSSPTRSPRSSVHSAASRMPRSL